MSPIEDSGGFSKVRVRTAAGKPIRTIMVGDDRLAVKTDDNNTGKTSDSEPQTDQVEETRNTAENSQFDPCVIAKNLENLLPKIDSIQGTGDVIRRRVEVLIRILKTRAFTEDQIEKAADPLMLTQRCNRLLLSAEGVTFPRDSAAPQRLNRRERMSGMAGGKSSTAYLEIHRETMAAAKEIEDQVRRALCITAPEDDPLFELFIAEMTEPDSLGEDILRLLGKELAGNKVYTDEIVGKLTDLKGKPVSVDSVNSSLGRMRPRTKGARFELNLGYGPRQEMGGRRFFHWLTVGSGESLDPDLIRQKTWAARLSTPGKTSDRTENLRVLTDASLQTRLSVADMAAMRGLDIPDDDYQVLKDRVLDPMNALIRTIERSDDPVVRTYSIRRLWKVENRTTKVEYVLVDRAESIEEWFGKMNIAQGTIRDRVFRKIFEYKLGTEFTVEQLVELLAQDGFATTTQRVGEAVLRTAGKDKNTGYEMMVRKTGQHHTRLISIKP